LTFDKTQISKIDNHSR